MKDKAEKAVTTGMIFYKYVNDEPAVLLQFRDNNPIEGKNTWATFGGHAESGESPQDAMKRELLEEIGIEIKDPVFLTQSEYKNDKQYFYILEINFSLSELKLNEGAGFALIPLSELHKYKLGFDIGKIIPIFRQWLSENGRS